MNGIILDISEWNSVAMALPSRAEELINATDAFADTVFVNTLKAKQNQVIYGRRGTGKTHLLKRLEEEYISKFEQYRVIPIFVNGYRLRNQANRIGEIPQVVALSLYIEFIKTLVSEIYEFINSRQEAGLLSKILYDNQSKTAQKAQSIAKEMYDLLMKGDVRFLPAGDASDEIQTLGETASKVAGGFKLTLDPRKLGWILNGETRRDKYKKKSEVTFRSIKGQIILPFNQVAEKIQELLKLLDGASLVVLFDEWSDTDDDLNTQPYLADMIKRTFSFITHMHVKLACIPNRTLLATPVTFQNPIPVGYEEGDDISADIDLDSIIYVQNDLRQFLPFFVNVLKKHMGISYNLVEFMEMQKFEEFIYNNIFEGTNVFSELCQASAGVPRDFLHIFRMATYMQVSKGDNKIKLIHIREASKQLHKSKRFSFRPDSDELIISDNIYRRVIAKHKTYFFLLKEKDSLYPAIKMLWAERLIHKMPASYYDSETHIKYIYYMMDYGECVDLLISGADKLGKETGTKMEAFIPNFQCFGWLGEPIMATIKSSLPMTMAEIAKALALENTPAGSLETQPKDLIFDDPIFESGS